MNVLLLLKCFFIYLSVIKNWSSKSTPIFFKDMSKDEVVIIDSTLLETFFKIFNILGVMTQKLSNGGNASKSYFSQNSYFLFAITPKLMNQNT